MAVRAVSSWSLHRVLGRFRSGDAPGREGAEPDAPAAGMPLLDVPAQLRQRGYDALQICHFHLPSRSPVYLGELRVALAEAEIELEMLLIDDGDLTSLTHAERDEAWIDGWLDTAATLGARRARVCAGRAAPTVEAIHESATRLARLAAAHPELRVVTENWLETTPDARSVRAILAAAGPAVGLLIDLGNWRGPDKYAALAAIAPLAESCHAKCHFTAAGPDREDFRDSLHVLAKSGFTGPLALIYDGPDADEWAGLDTEYAIVREVFPA